MKREDLKKQLVEAGIQEDKLGALVDYIMSQNGADLNTLKSENETLKATHEKELETLKAQNSELTAKVDSYKDYEDLKKFKSDTIANQEQSKRIDFLKSQGCKHPELIMSQIDFDSASYDDEKKTYIGLDDKIKAIKGSYTDLFEDTKMQQVNPNPAPKGTGSDFYEKYKKDHPELKDL
jgi:hypothetical protein